MFLKKLSRLHHTLAFRLTVRHTGIFTISFFGVSVVCYFLIASVIRDRIDQDLLSDKTEFSSLLVYGMDTVKTEIGIETKSEGANKIFFRILTITGEELATSDMSSWGNIGISRVALKRLNNGVKYVFETVETPGHRYKTRILYSVIGPGIILQVGKSLRDDERFMETFREIFVTAMAILTVFAALIGWFMARQALWGVEEVTRTALDISNGSLERRVPIKARGDEIDRLATAFNSMLGRIHALITEMKEITDNIAHDLRSPVTRIRGIAEMTLTTGKSMNEYETMAANTIEECDYLLEMVNTMLDISEVDTGASKLTMAKIDISGLINDACELFQPIADDKEITITSKVPATCFVYGDMQRLQRMVANLLDNAIKYTESGGTVTISATKDQNRVVISVSDTGIGISKDDLPHIFKRFYRCDRSRSQAGIGLGLSLAIAIAKAHGGNITATSSPGNGSTFTVILPQSSHTF